MPQRAEHKFPNELLHQIMLSLEGDHTALSRCNLVSRNLHAMSQPLQWKTLTLTDWFGVQRLHACFVQSPQLPGYVVDLSLGSGILCKTPASNALRTILADILVGLAHVVHLSLKARGAIYIAWSEIDSAVIAALAQHTFPHLRTLSFSRFAGITVQDVISCCPSLVRLSMEVFSIKKSSRTNVIPGLKLRELALKYYDETDFVGDASLKPILPAIELRSIELRRYARHTMVLSVGVEPLISSQLTTLQYLYLELDFRNSYLVLPFQTIGSLGISRFISLKVLEFHLRKDREVDPSPFFQWIATELNEARPVHQPELVIAINFSKSLSNVNYVAQAYGNYIFDYHWEFLDWCLINSGPRKIVLVFRMAEMDEYCVDVVKRALPHSTGREGDHRVVLIEGWDGSSMYFASR
ncbi:hypothetical protein DL96DRAFT_1720589 [Flagelloscypha sp. PMI_526]|nr:hypothetical protein DL96DRAFT_1720589 [Flagelloscypha sp. PMI_526]